MIKINTVTIKSPQRFSVDIKDLKAVDTNAAGNTVIDRVATKRTLGMEWGALTNTEVSTILTAMTAVFFSVEYPDPMTGAAKTITCYVGGMTAPVAKVTGGVVLWEGLTVDLIER